MPWPGPTSTVEPVYKIISEVASLKIDGFCTISACVCLFYDYIITFDREVELFWRGKWTGAAWLFLSNKYLSLMTQVLDLIEFTVSMSDDSCAKFSKAVATIDLCQYIPWAVFSGLRAYALSRNKPLGILVCLLSLATPFVNLIKYAYGLSGYNGPVWAVESCAEGGIDIPPMLQISCIDYARTSACEPKFVIISRSCLITADIILILITWITLHKRFRNTLGSSQFSFTQVLLRNGTVYFIIILTMNALHMVFSLPSVSRRASLRNFSQLTVYTEPITAILVSRFLIDLHDANRRPLMVASDDPLHLPDSATFDSLRFASVVSSLGASLSSPGSTMDERAYDEHGPTETTPQHMERGDSEPHRSRSSDPHEAGPSKHSTSVEVVRRSPSSEATLIVREP